jgi:hypothetical protein
VEEQYETLTSLGKEGGQTFLGCGVIVVSDTTPLISLLKIEKSDSG